MCGIAGILEYGRSRGGVDRGLLERMRDTMTHRGPDGEGLWISDDRRVGLGHRRLSIVDVGGGAQPMFGPRGTCVVYNGEIYNYPHLRRGLEDDGVVFRTDCDTEVILHLYERHGEGCVEYLNGMFAFALWDPREECLFFARDPVGEKPLFWTDVGGVLVFASEIKAILEHPLVPREVNDAAVEPYLANLATPSPDTLWRDVHKLAAGTCGRCDRRGVSIRRYTPPRTREWTDASDAEVHERVRSLLEQSTRARLMSDVGVGILLSGGMDSSTLVALLGDQAVGLPTFTIGFPGHDNADERAEAQRVAKLYATEHHEITLTDDEALAILPSMIEHQDEPLADPVCVPLFTVCGLVRSHGIKVVLAGEGADELFWGYHGYQAMVERWPRYRAALALPAPLRRLAPLAASGRTHPHRREQLEGIADGRLRPIHFPLALTGRQREDVLTARTGPGWAPSSRAAGEDARSTLAFDTQEYEFDVRLPELLLMRIDRFSMANSVEARVPFLDPLLVDYVYSLPLEHKVRAGITKHALKAAVADVVPAHVANRRKQGFAAPASQWFAGAHGELLDELVASDAMRRYFRPERVQQLARDAASGHWWAGQVLWPIFNFALWHRHWVEGETLVDVTSRNGSMNVGRRAARIRA
jgi:asparagine synthase (glutamine-hydrolysing)